jgi:hypothetical protein
MPYEAVFQQPARDLQEAIEFNLDDDDEYLTGF